MYPGADYGQLANKLGGATGQYTQGIDPDWTQLATMYGFRPNPYPAAGTEGQDQMRFMAVLKDIADAQLGGPTGPYSQVSPNNPIAGMPFGMSQYMSAMAPIFQSIQGKNLMPMDQANMMANGYQYGPLNTGTESSLQHLLRGIRSGAPVGQTPYQGVPAGPTAPNSTPGQAGQVSGGNTPGQTPPPAAESASGGIAPGAAALPQNPTAQQEIIAGLQQQPGNVSTPGVSTDRKEAQPYGVNQAQGVPAPLQQVWQDYLKYRANTAQTAQAGELNAWSGDIAKGFANWLGERFGRPAKA